MIENEFVYIGNESSKFNQQMFRLHADSIKDLCSSEKDDVVYGFQLGETYTYLNKHFIEMMELTDEIRKQS